MVLAVDEIKVWTKETQSNGMSQRTAISTVVLNNNILSIALNGWHGCDGSTFRFNDIWSSSDGGQTWQEITPSAAWSTRCCFAAVVYNESILVLGGKTWQLVTENALWSKRDVLGVVVIKDTIFVMCGHDGIIFM